MNTNTPSSRPIRKKARPGAVKSKSENDDTSSEGGAVIRALNESAQAMAQSFAEITSSLQERQAEYTQKYASALQTSVSGDAAEKINTAYQTILDAIASQDTANIAKAQESYLELLGNVTTAASEEANVATQDYTSGCESVLAEAHEQGQEQYFQYIDTLKSVLAKASKNDLPPGTLAIMAHNLASTASLSQGLFSPNE
ncbi:MAG: hypothetical protein GY949_11445 [Gammaproteobacteria bacterium]|nr:hypothetical protein [Gammaproteobacteria bacterium]